MSSMRELHRPSFPGLFQINFQIPQSLGANAAHRVDVKIGNVPLKV